MADDLIRIRLPNARQKLKTLFPEDPRGDVRIRCGSKNFKLQKAFLRLESGFFKRSFTPNTDILDVNSSKVKEQHFAKALKCFYGFTIEIPRPEILDYYQVVKYLEVESLLKVLREDMLARIESYDVFILMQLAYRYDEQQLFETSVLQLDKENFEQLRYSKLELLRCPTQLFKMIIKTHNRARADSGRGIQFVQVDQLIREFSEQKRLSQPEYQQLKFELIDKKSLTAQEYKDIFLDDAKRKKTGLEYKSMIKMPGSAPGLGGGLLGNSFGGNLLHASKLTESVVNQPIKTMSEELTLQMQNTFEKKKNQELQAENSYLTKELNHLRDVAEKNSQNYTELKQIVVHLQKQMEARVQHQKQQAGMIKQLQRTCSQLRKEVKDRGEMVRKMQEKLMRIERQGGGDKKMGVKGKPEYIDLGDDDSEESKTIQSQIVPSHLLKEIARPAAEALSPQTADGFKKGKAVAAPISIKSEPPPLVAEQVDEEIDEEDLEEMYLSRINFDAEPLASPKKYLPRLANFLTSQGFEKKKLDLLFRRTINPKQNIGESTDIFGKTSLLVLICTRMNQIIGGFTSVELQKGSMEYMADEKAFIFSLTRNEKFLIRKNSVYEAVFMTADHLICFSNDLMVAADCLKNNSECEWPQAYGCGPERKNARWLTGQQSSFGVKAMEVYQVQEEAMTMDL